jgi:hypothetical protein
VGASDLERIDLLHARYAEDREFKRLVRMLIDAFRDAGRLIVPPSYYARNRDAVDLASYRIARLNHQ